jgi:hypothetical protein
MSIDSTIRKPHDLSKINSNDIGELLWWSYTIGTTPEKIVGAINKVGNSADEIKRFIKGEAAHRNN